MYTLYMENIFSKIKSRKEPKVTVSMTIDKELLDKLKEIRKEAGVEKLSPVLNEVLWDWVRNQEEGGNNTKE